jgi:hypothetical protein
MEHKPNTYWLRWMDLREKWQSWRMETFRTNSKLDNQINIWSMSARVLPVLAILMAAILYLVDVNTYTQMFFIGVAIMFLAVSITWWWWVMYAIKDIHKNINISISQFDNIRKDINQLRKDIKKAK